MGRQELDLLQETLPENRAQITENSFSSSLFLVSTNYLKETHLKLALNNPQIKVTTINVEVAEREWERSFLEHALGENGHKPVVPEAIAYVKADHVVQRNPEARVIAADITTLTEDGRLLGKPDSLTEAEEIIIKEAGRKVTQTAGTAFWDGQQWFFGQTKVEMKRRHVNKNLIRQYVQANTPAVLAVAGGLPITDPEALRIFYEEEPFPTSIFCFDQKQNKTNLSPALGKINVYNHPLLIQTVLGFFPELLKAMKVI